MKRLRDRYHEMLVSGPRSGIDWLMFGGLAPLSCLYGAVLSLRRSLYGAGLKASYRAAVPVVSVGNLTAGGTGKTPMTDYLVKRLVEQGIKAAIVSRGYGGEYRTSVGVVSKGEAQLLMSPRECGDEPFLLARRNPEVMVFVARRRKLGVQAAEEAGAEMIILDDGFQHLAVQRDLDLLLFDARSPFGNGFILPAGPLREPRSAITAADLVVMTRAERGAGADVETRVPILSAEHRLSERLFSLDGNSADWGRLSGGRALAFAGIAKPESFFRSVREKGVFPQQEIAYSDHQDYDPNVLKQLSNLCHNYDFMLTTEKDAVKLADADFPVPCYAAELAFSLRDPAPLDAALENLIREDG